MEVEHAVSIVWWRTFSFGIGKETTKCGMRCFGGKKCTKGTRTSDLSERFNNHICEEKDCDLSDFVLRNTSGEGIEWSLLSVHLCWDSEMK